MIGSEVRKLLRKQRSRTHKVFSAVFITYDRLFRIAYYYVKREEWSSMYF